MFTAKDDGLLCPSDVFHRVISSYESGRIQRFIDGELL